MNIYIKSPAPQGAQADNPTNFSLSADLGVVTPANITYNQLTSGTIISLSDDAATQMTFSSQGFQPKTVIVNKDPRSCFQTSAVNYIEGNTRPSNPDGTNAPFRIQSTDSTVINNIFNLNIGDEFTFQVFGNAVEFTLFDKTTLGDEITIKATENNSETSWILISKNIITNEVNFIYDCHTRALIKYSTTNSVIEEWVRSDSITICHYE